ncbi:hypothetical protein MCP1_180020 [Candidatus Terasakiella magnetica]|nr:hypothetical protein MCP1_180020 [Candidatus Terasakiella magnetica]
MPRALHRTHSEEFFLGYSDRNSARGKKQAPKSQEAKKITSITKVLTSGAPERLRAFRIRKDSSG